MAKKWSNDQYPLNNSHENGKNKKRTTPRRNNPQDRDEDLRIYFRQHNQPNTPKPPGKKNDGKNARIAGEYEQKCTTLYGRAVIINTIFLSQLICLTTMLSRRKILCKDI